ncbi:hypothetical protein Kpho02_68920 [Kitasatospora phosalacinea]|uniref:Uncharacterized protein n=1 Tax=Kitasatospora phosalacinea TaxID=2065 RepID=A0A9W6QEC4_9ACTN|nr:hypothetical protein Kpho02_68920 [Kitasatospora phosalacinea]
MTGIPQCSLSRTSPYAPTAHSSPEAAARPTSSTALRLRAHHHTPSPAGFSLMTDTIRKRPRRADPPARPGAPTCPPSGHLSVLAPRATYAVARRTARSAPVTRTAVMSEPLPNPTTTGRQP